MGKKFLVKNTSGRYGYTELINDNGHMYNKFTDLYPNIPDETLKKLAEFFSMFSDSTRVKIITALCLGKMCVNDLSVIEAIEKVGPNRCC